MKKIILLALAVLVLPALSRAEDDIALVRKSCYPALFKVFCKGEVRNETDRDIDNILIRFSSPTYLRRHLPQVETEVYDEIDRLPARATEDFVVVWDTTKTYDKADPDILREYILMSIRNETMEVDIVSLKPGPPTQAAVTPLPAPPADIPKAPAEPGDKGL